MVSRIYKSALGATLLSAPLLLHGQAPVGELYSTVARVRGSVTLAAGGTTVLSGSSIDSGEQPARLELNRGGQIIVCQKTSISVSANATGRDLMFSFGTGTIQAHYKIGASSDVVITPDFRMSLTGPGEFELDIGISPQGDTCVRSSRQSTAGVIINEQLGDGTYQVKPSDYVVFRKGRVANAEPNPADTACGCPFVKPAIQQIEVAKTPPPQPAPQPVAAAPQPAPVPTQAPAEHVVAEAPFVFNGDGAPPPATSRVIKLKVESKPAFADLHPQVVPPAKRAQKKGFWRRFAKALFG